MFEEYESLRKIVGNSLDCPGMGGNISVKNSDLFMIKSSGQDMKDYHWVTIESEEKFSFRYNCDTIETGKLKKMSMEYKLHKILPSKFVVHYHPAYVFPYLCSDYQFEFGTTLDYYTPGEELATALKDADAENIIFLKNHGVIIHADTIEEIHTLYNKIKDYFFEKTTVFYAPDDVIDSENTDLYLHRMLAEYIAQKKNLKLNTLSEKDINKLINNDDEKYRMEQIS